MSKFKVGDRVKVKENAPMKYGGNRRGSECTITKVLTEYPDAYLTDTGFYNAEEDLELLDSKIELNMKEKFIQMFLSEPEKSFRKAEITNGDGLLTSDGQQVFLTWLLKKHGNEFKTDVVDELLKEDK